MADHYIDNKKFYEALKEYKQTVREAESLKKPKPQIPNYIGDCLILIARRLATKPNFISYPYRDEMIADGIENCVMYFDNFDPDKYNNPFAYFTQIIYFAFLRRIQKEKKQLYIKHQVLKNSMVVDEMFSMQEGDDGDVVQFDTMVDTDKMNDFIKSFEDNLEKKRRPTAKVGLQQYFDDD